MKIRNILTITALALMFAACDKIDENERYSEATGINEDRKVLVEEFTGQFCGVCPFGHKALDNIKAIYGDNAVIVSIHSGGMAFEDPDYGLKTTEGDTYAAMHNIQRYPSAVVNRTSGVMEDRSQWQGAVFNAAKAAPVADIKLSAEVADGKINITSILSATYAMSASYQLWITEDDIITFQQKDEDDNHEIIEFYHHNHVYRASVNGIRGEGVSLSSDASTITHSIPVDARWNTANINVVAFLYNANGVLQAEEVKVNK